MTLYTRRTGFSHLPVTACAALLAVHTASADPIPAGIDLWFTPDNGTSWVSFEPTPIPAGFFDPGSDPFDAFVPVKGAPLSTTPPGAFGTADTIVRRTAPAALACPGSAMVPIEIVALHLVSATPVTVTYNGGATSELWNLRICLSDSPQSGGMMTINQQCAGGGTYDSTLFVTPKFTFTRVSDLTVRTLDAASAPMGDPYGAMPLLITGGHWVHSPDPSFFVLTSGGGVTVDGNCNGAMDPMPLPATSNFAAGIRGVSCGTCLDPVMPQRGDIDGEAKTGDPLAATHMPIPGLNPVAGMDGDGDGVPNVLDNCPDDANPDQADQDDDGLGDVCDDSDGDTVPDATDNCVQVANLDQSDQDDDGQGDVCDPCPFDPADTMVEGECIPTMSEWGLLVVALLLLTAGSLVLRRDVRVAR